MNKKETTFFPTMSGTYLALRQDLTIMCKFTGMFPNLTLAKIINVSNLFIDQCMSIRKCKIFTEKELINSILTDREAWKFVDLSEHNPFTWVDSASQLGNIDEEQELKLRKIYYNILRAGESWTKMIDVIRIRTNCSRDVALNLIKQFDEEKYNRHNF